MRFMLQFREKIKNVLFLKFFNRNAPFPQKTVSYNYKEARNKLNLKRRVILIQVAVYKTLGVQAPLSLQ